MISNNPHAVVLNDHWIPLIIEYHWSFVKIHRSETVVRFSHTKKCDRLTHRQTHSLTHRHSRLEKALLALKKLFPQFFWPKHFLLDHSRFWNNLAPPLIVGKTFWQVTFLISVLVRILILPHILDGLKREIYVFKFWLNAY